MVNLYNSHIILLGSKKERTTDTCNTNESQKYDDEWEKPDTLSTYV